MKHLPLKLPVLLLAATLISFAANAQRFDSVLNVLDSRYPQEKIYLHFDRSLYTPGETIWFKAYIFSGAFPSQISKTVYAELLDEQGKLLQRKSAPVFMSAAAAAFDLPADLKSSQVYVRAYTKWMLNFDQSFLFEKNIPIAVKRKSAGATAPTAYLQFFPEGGNLVSGLTSKIAFKATDGRGLPFNVKGDIVDGTGKKVNSFTSEHDGMGLFVLQPQPGQQYKAVWKDQAGKSQETALPQAQAAGLVMEVNNNGEKIDFSITRSADAPYRSVHVVAQMHQQLLYRAKANLSSRNSASGSIPVVNLPAGIIQVTVFSEAEQPIAERIIFINPEDNYFITDLNAAAKNLVKRGRNVIQIDVPDTIACNLSVSVTDAGLNPADKNEGDIFSHLLLTSDIKGYVHQPAYYFSGTEAAARHLDLVMLTNGWRRFRWEDALAGKYPTITHQPEGYLTINGKVSGLNRAQLSGKELTGMLEAKSAGKDFVTIPVQPDGQFSIPDLIFYDTAKLYYQFTNDKEKRLTTLGVFSFRSTLMGEPLQTKPDLAKFPLPEQADSLVAKNDVLSQRRRIQDEEQRKVQTLAAVEVRAKQKSQAEKMEEDYTSGLFRGGNAHTFILEGDPRAMSSTSVLQYLQGKVAGLQISGNLANPSVTWRFGTPTIFLNEMQQDVAFLQSIPMTDVAMIKVFNPPFVGGSAGGGASGAIAVYTKKGGSTEEVKGLSSTTVIGYSPIKEFYSPDYSKEGEAHDLADYRTTLLWEPFVLTDKNKRRILLTFYNNDVTRRIRVVVEGFDVDGKLTRIEKVFE